MSNLAKIEGVKLAANLANGLATALISIGVFGPLGTLIFSPATVAIDPNILWNVPIICICGALTLHLAGQWLITLLGEADE